MAKYAQKTESDKEKKVTFFTKETIRCPVCDGGFHREELFSGRVNANELTDELHRVYTPMQAFGEVYPLVYEVTVCPSCYYATFKQDFSPIGPKVKEPLQASISSRIESVQRAFPGMDFQSQRGLLEGAASYFLALMCYDSFGKDYTPTVKQAIASLRCSWLCSYLEERRPKENFAYLSSLFVQKARILYRAAVQYEQSGKQQMSLAKWLGPDTDKNYGYEGVLYLAVLLEFKYGTETDEAKRVQILEDGKRTIAKMFGLGKRSKAKPGPLLDKARELYDELKVYLKEDDDDV